MVHFYAPIGARTCYLELCCLYRAYLIKIKGTGLSRLMDGLEGICLAKFCLPLTNSFKFCISRKSANFSFTYIWLAHNSPTEKDKENNTISKGMSPLAIYNPFTLSRTPISYENA